MRGVLLLVLLISSRLGQELAHVLDDTFSIAWLMGD